MSITDRDVAELCLGIYPGHPSPTWDHFDDGSDLDGVCWGVKHVDDVSIVVLRGTVTLGDWLRNFQAWVEPIHHDNLGPVHAGFYSGGESIQKSLTPLAQATSMAQSWRAISDFSERHGTACA
jgi:hypothetical protein